jgi:phospholipid/cholesterol/gamma-HCH transport system permease protein
MTSVVARLGELFTNFLRETGGISLLLFDTVTWMVTPPFRIRNIFKQMEFVGIKSIWVIILTGVFGGMVVALGSYTGFRRFGGESLLGSTVALAMARELGPVLTGLMVTARAGSGMAAELGTMRVTEQIDALATMAVNPVQYLVVPRIIAGVLMVPVLTIVCAAIGILGGYFVSVSLLGLNPGLYMANTIQYVEVADILKGVFKGFSFGFILSLISCYKGFYATGGAEGVGRVTTEAVVLSSISILIGNYILTSFLF